ncbi:hypothetical protein [Christiangramia crocea]|uniref:Uncharacterized protein n=1 Tax=Christiangramia crocea TaxID=2904124 RepID=A0A9X1UXA4_9FLAO|nr:hypothetical protein [Gramella crocea]MCG9971038.1 hypothetical protein [Gramella crocea]
MKQPQTFDAWCKELGLEAVKEKTGLSKHVISHLRNSKRLENKYVLTYLKVKEAIPEQWDIKLWFPLLKEL